MTEVIDARGNVAETREHGMLGQVLRTMSADAGDARAIADVLGAPLRAVDARGNVFFCEYDALRRPIEDWVATPAPSGGQVDLLLAKRVFGDGENDGKAGGTRQRGRLVRVFDGGGMTSIDAYDLDGNVTSTTRRLVDLPRVFKTAQLEGRPARACTDWSALGGITSLDEIAAMLPTIDLLEDKAHRATTRYDARGRAIETTLPLSGSTHRTRYTEDGLLQRIERETAAGTREPVYEAEDFDHLGRPRRVRQGDAVRTSFTYDVITERLLRLQTTASGRALQDLHYAYDPVGNITQVRDGAQAVVFRDNAELAASNDYRYDALYRLVEATGREHEGQAANGRTPRANDAVVVPLRTASPSDPNAMRRYVQRYRYDAVGNLTTLQHFAGAGSYRRESAYSEHGCRLRATGNAALALHERYEHDVAGHMVAMPHLSRLQWDELGQLEFVSRGTQQVWLQYAGGARVRKLVFSGEGVVEDRVYLGAEEMYTKRRAGAVVEQTLTEHAGGGLSVDIKLVADGKAVAKPVGLRRYAVADHLGSCKLEVDPDGKVIAYEEFHPYGTTSYRAMRSGLDAAANRYRFTGMERDEETGLAQHGARYYAGWLGRWVSADPIGVAGGINCYAYSGGNPVGYVDRDGCRARAPDELGDGDSSELEEYGTGMTEEDQAELDGREPYVEEESVDPGEGPSFFDVATWPHRFAAGQIVGALEGSWAIATALPKLSVALYEDPAAVASAFGERWDEGGALAFTPLPTLWSHLGGMFAAEDAFDAGRHWGGAAVSMGESVGLGLGLVGGARSLLAAGAEQASKLLATRGILFADIADVSGLGAAAAEAGAAIGEGAAVGARAMAPRWRAPTADSGFTASPRVSPSQLRPTEKLVGRGKATPREHIEEIANSMRKHGWNGPPVSVVRITEQAALDAGLPQSAAGWYIVDGHHRARAAAKVGIDVVYEQIPFATAQARHGWASLRQLFFAWAELP